MFPQLNCEEGCISERPRQPPVIGKCLTRGEGDDQAIGFEQSHFPVFNFGASLELGSCHQGCLGLRIPNRRVDNSLWHQHTLLFPMWCSPLGKVPNSGKRK